MAKTKKKGGFGAVSRLKPRPKVVAAAPNTPKKEEEGKLIEYGTGDKLPSDMIKVFTESPTATLCWEKRAKFIKADGFANGATGKLRVNPEQTLDDLLPELAWDAAPFAFVLLVKYKTDLSVGEVYHVPFHTVRKLTNGKFVVNPTLGSSDYKKDKDKIHEAFDNSPAVVQEVINQAQALEATNGPSPDNQPGQILYVYQKNSQQPHYPVPASWSGRLDMETEPQILKADHKGVANRVQTNVKVFIPGGLDNANPDESGQTELDKASEAIGELFSEDAQFMVFTGATKDDAPQVDYLDNFDSLGSSDSKRETIGRAICRWWGIPPELVGWATSGQLGNVEQLKTIIGMLQQDVLDIQSMIQRTVEMLYPAFDATLTNYNIIGDIPERVWQIMNEDEKRNTAGLPELDTEQTSEGQKVLNALNSLSPLVANKVLESMTKNQILELVGLPPIEGGDTMTEETQETQANASTIKRGFSKVRAFFKKRQ